MKFPLPIRCDQCDNEELIFLKLNETSIGPKCKKCGNVTHHVFGSNFTVGYRILERSNYEITKGKDYPLSIVFSAAAFECELTRLHFKWSEIDALNKGAEVSDEKLEGLLRKYRTIDVKIEEVCKLMDPRGFRQFVIDTSKLRDIVKSGFPSLRLEHLTKDFQEKLFWPRNRVLHLADISFSKDESMRCYNIATLGLLILDQMDKHRRTTV